MIDFNRLVRDGNRIKNSLIEQGDQLITKTGCKIYIPVSWEDKRLATIGKDTRIVAIYAMVIEDKYYSPSVVMAPMPIRPTRTTIIKIDDVPYYEFVFEPGAVITPNLNLVQISSYAYLIYNEMIAKAHVPWYLNYIDLLKILSTAEEYGNITLAANNVPIEILVATIARNNTDVTKYHRHNTKTLEDLVKSKPSYVPLGSVLHGATNTTAKLMGNYLDDGITSALIKPTSQIDTVETLFRI